MSEAPTAEQIASDKVVMAEYDNIDWKSSGNIDKNRGGLAGFIILGVIVLVICWGIAAFIYKNLDSDETDADKFWIFVFVAGGIAACGCTIHYGGIVKMQKIYDDEVAQKQAEFKAANDWDAIQSRKERFSDLYK